jgi:hypothetical protein
VVGWHRDQQWLPKKSRDVECCSGDRKLRQDQVLAAIIELAHQVTRRGLADVKAQVRVGAVQIAHHMRHQVGAERGRRAHPDCARKAGFQRDRQIQNALGGIQHLAPPARDLAPGHRQAHRSAPTFDKGLVKRVLQRLDLHRQGRLRNPAAFRRFAEVMRLFQRDEVSKLAQREGRDRVGHGASQILVRC